jgi:hypothetical protein
MGTQGSDNWNLERYIASDARFTPHVGGLVSSSPLYDFNNPKTGRREEGLCQYEAVSLKADLDEAATLL